jgi:hypothetical protein
MESTKQQSDDDFVCFRAGNLVSNDLRHLIHAASQRVKVEWYTRRQMRFMQAAAGGPQWKQFAEGPGLNVTAPY